MVNRYIAYFQNTLNRSDTHNIGSYKIQHIYYKTNGQLNIINKCIVLKKIWNLIL